MCGCRAPYNADPYTELGVSGSCGPADPSIEDFNNPLLYQGAPAAAGYPQIVWEVESSHPAATRAGVVVDAVRTLTVWEHIEYHRENWVNTCASIGDLSAGNACQEMIGTFFECEAACSSNPECGAFSRDSNKADTETDLCSLIKNAAGPTGAQTGLVTFVKEHTIIPPGIWTKQTGAQIEADGESIWLHANNCAEATWKLSHSGSHSGFEIKIMCINGVSPPFGDYELHFEHQAFACKPFEGRGDFVRLYDGRTVGDRMVGMVDDCTAPPTMVSAAVHTCTGTAQAEAGAAVPVCDLDPQTDPQLGPDCPYGCTEVDTPATYSCSAAGCVARANYTACAPAPFNCTAPHPSVRQQGFDYTICDMDALDQSSDMCYFQRTGDSAMDPYIGCVSAGSTTAAACTAVHGSEGFCPSNQPEQCMYAGHDSTDQLVTTCPAEFQTRTQMQHGGDPSAICTGIDRACSYSPEYKCELQHHGAACEAMGAVFTGTMADVAANGGAPLNSPFAATGSSLLLVATARGSEDTRRAAQLQCENSYRAGSVANAPGSCSPGCVLINTPDATTGNMVEGCAVIGDVGGFNATFTCEPLPIDTSWLPADRLAQFQAECPSEFPVCLSSRSCVAELYQAFDVNGSPPQHGGGAEMQAFVACMDSQFGGDGGNTTAVARCESDCANSCGMVADACNDCPGCDDMTQCNPYAADWPTTCGGTGGTDGTGGTGR